MAAGVLERLQKNLAMCPYDNHLSPTRPVYFAVTMVIVIFVLGCGRQTADQRELSNAIRAAKTESADGRKEIYLWEKQIDDEDLRQLASLTELHSLAIPHARNVTNASMEIIANIPGLQNLDLAGTGINNEGLEPLRNHPTLTRLVVNETRVTDAGLAIIATIPNLEVLELYRCRVTDEGLRHIGRMRNLVRISLDSTPVTDRGLVHLYPLQNLRRLQVGDTHVTASGINAFQRRRPDLTITN